MERLSVQFRSERYRQRSVRLGVRERDCQTVRVTAGMNEGRRLKFFLSLRRFLNWTWKLQRKVILANLLQVWSFDQCDRRGISERTVVFAPFQEVVTHVLRTQPGMDALAGGVSLAHLKIAFFLLIAQCNERTITPGEWVCAMAPQAFLDGPVMWKDAVLAIVNAQINSSGEDRYRALANEPPPVSKIQAATAAV
jgi:hypothetical protein